MHAPDSDRLAKMKRRLRKKLRLGEFRELGFTVKFSLPPETDAAIHDRLIWAFFTDAVEANGLEAGGGGDVVLRFFLANAQGRGSVTEAQREQVRQWLAARPELTSVEVGELEDAWYDTPV